jgi:hypothetical protein
LAAPQGFEPRYADPESAVLPLNEGAACGEKADKPRRFRFYGRAAFAVNTGEIRQVMTRSSLRDNLEHASRVIHQVKLSCYVLFKGTHVAPGTQ